MDIIRLLRPRQWYKNLLVFLPLFFSGSLFSSEPVWASILGFISLCLMSSANYIINDIFDRAKDRAHPEKMQRPLASGSVRIWQALVIFVLIFLVSLGIAYMLNPYFTFFVLALFTTSLVYSRWLREEIIADVLLISINFVIRAVSGAFVIVEESGPYVWVSPWLVLTPLFLALFLASAKRRADFLHLKEQAIVYRRVLGRYNQRITASLMNMSTALLVMSYSLYSILSVHPQLIITLPLAIYAILRYHYLVEKRSEIGRHPEKVFLDMRMVLTMLAWALLAFILIYQ